MPPGRSYSSSFSFGGPLTPAVRWIIIATVAVYVLEFFGPLATLILEYLALWPSRVVGSGFVWQLATYLLVHSIHPLHLVFNMLAVWMFGGAIESHWGSRRFLWYYVGTGVAAGVCVVLAALVAGGQEMLLPTIGASGAVFGLLVAFGMLFPEDTVLFIVFPMRAKHFVLLLIAIEMAILLGASSSTTSPVAHLGGALVGWLYLKFSWRVGNWYKASFGPRSKLKVVPREVRETRRPVMRDVVPSAPSMVPPSRVVEAPRPRVSAEEALIQKRADEILDKIAREGMGSLTREERGILNKHSQILKQREAGVVNIDDYRS